MSAGGWDRSGNRRLTSADVPVVPVLATLGSTTQTPAGPGRRRPADAATMGWRPDSAVPPQHPPGPIRRRWELPHRRERAVVESPPPSAPSATRRLRGGGSLDSPDDLCSSALVRPPYAGGVKKAPYAQHSHSPAASWGPGGCRGQAFHATAHTTAHTTVAVRPRSPSTAPYSRLRYHPGSAGNAYDTPFPPVSSLP